MTSRTYHRIIGGLTAFLLLGLAGVMLALACAWRLPQAFPRFCIALPIGMAACLGVWLIGGYTAAVAWGLLLLCGLVIESYLYDSAPRRRRRKSPIIALGQGDYMRMI